MFRTQTGRVVPAVTADQMREVDRIAVDRVGLALLQMMENAGRALARTVRERVDTEATADDDPSILVLAGGGGNGGGGLAAARHLDNGGASVRVVLDREPDDLSVATARQRRILDMTSVTVDGESRTPTDLRPGEYDAVVDALVGYGLTDALRGRAAALVEQVPRTVPTVSLDVPSGVNATTGSAPGTAVAPDLTVTLALPKSGLSAENAGDLWLADIGIPASVYARAGIDYTQPFDGRSRVRVTSDERS